MMSRIAATTPPATTANTLLRACDRHLDGPNFVLLFVHDAYAHGGVRTRTAVPLLRGLAATGTQTRRVVFQFRHVGVGEGRVGAWQSSPTRPAWVIGQARCQAGLTYCLGGGMLAHLLHPLPKDRPLTFLTIRATWRINAPMGSVIEAHKRHVGRRIKLARQQAGLSLDALGTIVGTRRQHLIKLERGQHLPRPAMLARIAKATGRSESWFEVDDESVDA